MKWFRRKTELGMCRIFYTHSTYLRATFFLFPKLEIYVSRKRLENVEGIKKGIVEKRERERERERERDGLNE